MDARKLSALYGLKRGNPFLEDIPIEALCETPRIKHFAWRVEDLVSHGGFALVTGDVGAGKSAALRMLAAKLAPLRDVIVGEVTRPQSRVTDFYRDRRPVRRPGLDLEPVGRVQDRAREAAGAHPADAISSRVARRRGAEMSPLLLAELRLLGSTKLDTCTIVTVVLCGDRRLEEAAHAGPLARSQPDPDAPRARRRAARRARHDAAASPRRRRQRGADDRRAAAHRVRTRCRQPPRADEPVQRAARARGVEERQARLDEGIYLELASADHRPARAGAPARAKPARR
ncbi:MAG: hypothetical protein HS111_04695 [Kofleriaceae bacterium]|nr:hypothetical protein [Kofleriaceae bacterium]